MGERRVGGERIAQRNLGVHLLLRRVRESGRHVVVERKGDQRAERTGEKRVGVGRDVLVVERRKGRGRGPQKPRRAQTLPFDRTPPRHTPVDPPLPFSLGAHTKTIKHQQIVIKSSDRFLTTQSQIYEPEMHARTRRDEDGKGERRCG